MRRGFALGVLAFAGTLHAGTFVEIKTAMDAAPLKGALAVHKILSGGLARLEPVQAAAARGIMDEVGELDHARAQSLIGKLSSEGIRTLGELDQRVVSERQSWFWGPRSDRAPLTALEELARQCRLLAPLHSADASLPLSDRIRGAATNAERWSRMLIEFPRAWDSARRAPYTEIAAAAEVAGDLLNPHRHLLLQPDTHSSRFLERAQREIQALEKSRRPAVEEIRQAFKPDGELHYRPQSGESFRVHFKAKDIPILMHLAERGHIEVSRADDARCFFTVVGAVAYNVDMIIFSLREVSAAISARLKDAERAVHACRLNSLPVDPSSPVADGLFFMAQGNKDPIHAQSLAVLKREVRSELSRTAAAIAAYESQFKTWEQFYSAQRQSFADLNMRSLIESVIAELLERDVTKPYGINSNIRLYRDIIALNEAVYDRPEVAAIDSTDRNIRLSVDLETGLRERGSMVGYEEEIREIARSLGLQHAVLIDRGFSIVRIMRDIARRIIVPAIGLDGLSHLGYTGYGHDDEGDSIKFFVYEQVLGKANMLLPRIKESLKLWGFQHYAKNVEIVGVSQGRMTTESTPSRNSATSFGLY